MRARRRRQSDPVPQSSTVANARSNLAAETFSAGLPITTSRSSGLPLSHTSNFGDVSSAREDVKTKAVTCIPKSIPRPPLSHLVQELLDQAFIQPDEASLDEDDLPCASGATQKGRRANDFRSFSPRSTWSPDRLLSGNSGERVKLVIITAFTDIGISLWFWACCYRRAGPRILHTARLPNQHACGIQDPGFWLATTRVIEVTRHWETEEGGGWKRSNAIWMF